MALRYLDSLETFTRIARYDSFSSAAEALNLTKGAISHQIRKLEEMLEFELFKRLPRGIVLTQKGEQLLLEAKAAFGGLEKTVRRLSKPANASVTVAVSTYFASRWLSQRLMNFMNSRPDVQIRIQPMVNLQEIEDENVDLVIRWGNGTWEDVKTECLFLSPVFPAGNNAAAALVEKRGFGHARLLRDWDGSTAWRDWHEAAGLPLGNESDSLVIPDPNVRVQAVIDGQGIALLDSLVSTEIKEGRLKKLTRHSLDNYGYYLARMPAASDNPAAGAFADWLHAQSAAVES